MRYVGPVTLRYVCCPDQLSCCIALGSRRGQDLFGFKVLGMEEEDEKEMTLRRSLLVQIEHQHHTARPLSFIVPLVLPFCL